MPQQDQHNASRNLPQEALNAQECWNDLVQHLPPNLEEQARTLGAFQRVRCITSAQSLLRALLCYVLSLSSLKDLSVWGRLSGASCKVLSAQAWHKRLRQSQPWLLWLLNALLGRLLLPGRFRTTQRILLVDATHLSEQGRTGQHWRLHCAYDLLRGLLAWVHVTDHHVGEGFGHVPIQAGDILVGDGAYSRATQILAVAQAKGFSLTHFSPRHLCLYAAQAPEATTEFRIPVVEWLKGLVPGTYQRYAMVIQDGQRLLVRLIAVALPEEQAETLRRRKEHEARDKGRRLSDEARFLAGFHLLVTTLPEPQWPLGLVLELYRSRWQIEILFKRIKQVLDVHRLVCESALTAQAMIAALLVGWLLVEEQTTQLQQQIADAEPLGEPISLWQLNRLAFSGLLKVVEGWWSPKQLIALAPELRRLFRERRRRTLREHQRRSRFLALLAPHLDLGSSFSCSSA